MGVARGPVPYAPHPTGIRVQPTHHWMDALRQELLDEDDAMFINDAVTALTLVDTLPRSVAVLVVNMHMNAHEFEPMYIRRNFLCECFSLICSSHGHACVLTLLWRIRVFRIPGTRYLRLGIVLHCTCRHAFMRAYG